MAALAPSVARPALAGQAADGVDEAALSFLLRRALEDKRKEEQLAKEEEEERKRQVWDSLEQKFQQLLYESSSSTVRKRKRKRKKRRKRRTPRTSSRSSCGRARRRQRQWHFSFVGFLGDVPVFPSVSGRLVMLCIMAGMDQTWFFKFVDNPGSGTCRVGFTGYDAPRVMFPSGVAQPRMLGIMAGLVQMDSCSGV